MNTLEILNKTSFTAEDIMLLLQLQGAEKTLLFEKAAAVKKEHVQNKVYFRGLVEYSNHCSKNCFYCGIRKDNRHVNRYQLADEDVLSAARFAFENRYASIVLQSGELASASFTRRIENLLGQIHSQTQGRLRVTLSCGEQSAETYRRWFDKGGQRYLLRIETANPELYRKLHPDNDKHSFDARRKCLETLKEIGYQVGSGIMIGLPFQTLNDLAHDLLFLEEIDVDMVGMGPYLEHRETPLFLHAEQLLPREERFQLTLKMIAILRLMMKDINIAATTALQAIDKLGREKAIKVGANVVMPNITPGKYRDDYNLYENKPCTDENAEDCLTCLETRIALTEHKIAYNEWGDSMHYRRKK
jgi:biotin synthase